MTKMMTINDIREAHVDQFPFHTSGAARLSRLHKVLPFIFPPIMIFPSLIIFPSISNAAKSKGAPILRVASKISHITIQRNPSIKEVLKKGTYIACRIPDQPGWSPAQHQGSRGLCSRCTSLGLGWLLNIISILIIFLYTPEHYHHPQYSCTRGGPF